MSLVLKTIPFADRTWLGKGAYNVDVATREGYINNVREALAVFTRACLQEVPVAFTACVSVRFVRQ